ncbi:hypothetical protein BOTBODRAFT_115291 [Botryobasidium botryosum FD-172 SS1]|uniref:Nuclear pore complex protein n=1 Tax=Botryobasidium botryosum (strain FD-172 SS1) TaxID=930990 RepID=A0A067MGP5_BOTB1|nr:hypothetical protein BOTBODRAFT_115291 [Botryobasidium botryosum FD-172 SS1]
MSSPHPSTLFAQTLQLLQQSPTPEVVLDTTAGLAPRFQEICANVLSDLERSARDDGGVSMVSADELEAWRLERDTWALVAPLYFARDKSPDAPQPSTAQELLAKNPYTPEKAILRRIVQEDYMLDELSIVRAWLHDTAPEPVVPEDRPYYWRFTKLELVHQLRGGQARAGKKLVTELDPDAASRTGAVLDAQDAEFDKVLNQAIYAHIRAGNLYGALEICHAVDQPWRSALLRGAFAFVWKDITSRDPHDDIDEDEIDEAEAEIETSPKVKWSGNRRRRLWRETCARGANSATLHSTHRTLLAALSPSGRTLAALQPALRTFEDHLWARVSALVEERFDAVLDKLGGHWASKSKYLDNATGAGVTDSEMGVDDVWHDNVKNALEEMEHVKPEIGSDYSHPIRLAQMFLILDRTDTLFTLLAREIQAGRLQTDRQYPLVIQFYAHLCLFLRLVGKHVPPDAADVVLQAYVMILEQEKRGELVALYIGALGSNALDRYAEFLADLDMNTSKRDCAVALNRAKDHGLDVIAVAEKTGALVCRRELRTLPPHTMPLPSPASFDIRITEKENVLIRSVEWLTVHQETYEQALTQANALLRYLLGHGRILAARQLLASLPRELVQKAHLMKIEGREHVHFQKFFTVWDAFTDVGEVKAQEPVDRVKKMEILEWKKAYAAALENVREVTLSLLKEDWMRPDEQAPIDERRDRELIRIRQIYVPELVLRLHQELFMSRTAIPSNLKLVMEFATVVADQRYEVYRDFVNEERNRIDEYLGALRVAGLAALDSGSDPF